MSVKLLTAHHLEFLSLKGGCTCPSESTLVKMPHCWKLHVAAHLFETLMPQSHTHLRTLTESFGSNRSRQQKNEGGA